MLKIDFTQAYQTISWLCWVPNLLIAEVLVYSRSAWWPDLYLASPSLEELTDETVLAKSDPALHQENFDVH